MTMEHRRPDGTLAQGYYCAWCGAPGLSMYAAHHGPGACEPNPELVKELEAMNRRSAPPHAPPPDIGGAMCRGSWLLGTACGHCRRCTEEAPRAIEGLRATVETYRVRLNAVVGCIPPRPRIDVDYIDSVKIRLFDAVREQLYDEQGKLR